MIKKQLKPSWLKVPIPSGKNIPRLKKIFRENGINTICKEALCPNLGECSKKGVATFLILGDKCTRNCLYCNVKTGKPGHIDLSEAKRVALVVKALQLNYVVVTSVTRDDLEDGGTGVFVDAINEIKTITPDCKVEVLVPDFSGRIELIKDVVEAQPFVFAHNLEVTEDFFNRLRPEGDFNRSLKVLRTAKIHNPCQKTKSGIMIGFGETKQQILKAMSVLRENMVDIFTIGQYLQPSKKHFPVKKYYMPEEFDELEKIGYEWGFSFVKSGPLVRSSYMADEIVKDSDQ